MSYAVTQIPQSETERLCSEFRNRPFFPAKADIHGVCVKLYTEDRETADMWEDNFYSMSDSVRSHARLICVSDERYGTEVLYDINSKTAFLFNFSYYGWVKSIALAIASDILEDAHGIHWVHGAALDADGLGVTLIAPSKTGKTTQSWGLLRSENTRLVTDDWYFVKMGGGRPIAAGSEKNCYVDADIGDVWEEYKPLVKTVKFDSNGRGIANIRWVAGLDSVIPMTSIRYIILMKRDKDDKEAVRKMTSGEAVAYLEENDYCNPHQMVRDERKMSLRKRFFTEYLKGAEVYMVNTILEPRETQERIREIVKRP